MRQPLGRIEREYVVGEISRAKPAFELSGEGCDIHANVTDYSLDGDLVSFRPRSWKTPRSFPARVRFLHKKRYMRFVSEIRVADGIASFLISPEVVPEDEDAQSADDRLVLSLSGRTCRCDGIPTASDGAGSSVLGDASTAAALAERIGLPSDHVNARERLYSFILAVRDAPDLLPRTAGRGVCVFLDHRVLLVALVEEGRNGLEASSLTGERVAPVAIFMGARAMRFSAGVLGRMRVTDRVVILALDCVEAHEEDKRMLFERQYKSLYM